MLEIPESELIARAKADPTAFGELYRRHIDAIYSYAYHRVGNAADAEDLTARTFQRALASMPAYVDRGAPFAAWLYRIAHNLIANWHRDQSRRQSVSLDGLGSVLDDLAADGDDGLAVQAWAHARVAEIVRRLDPERQDLLILKFAHGLSNTEIAATLGRTESAVKSLYHRTLLALRDQLAPEHGARSPEAEPPWSNTTHDHPPT